MHCIINIFRMFQKLVFPAFLLWIFSCWLTYADFKEYNDGKKIAQQYLDSNKNDDFWKDNSPRLWESTPLYMEKETPSYFEYSVICDRNIDCGFIIVNVDWDDIDIPVASPSDIPPSQTLTQKSGTNKKELQFFYFSPFDIYSKNSVTGQINAINPQDNPMEEDIFENITKEKQEIQKKEQEEFLKIKFLWHMQYWKEYRNSDNFQKIKENIQKYSITPSGSPGTEVKNGWKYVKWTNSSDCNSRIPCYKQHWYTTYLSENWAACYNWCSPVAAAMIFAYHDKELNYPELFKNKVAPMTNVSFYPWESQPTPRGVIDEIRWLMWTQCYIDFRRPNDPKWGWTQPNNIPNGVVFAWNHWYPWSMSWIESIQSQIFPRITTEMNNGRPLLINIYTKWKDSWAQPNIHPLDTVRKDSGHTVVGYGYKMNNNSGVPNQVRINAPWGSGNYSNLSISLFNITNIDLSDPDYSLYTFPTITRSVVWYHING